MNYVDKFNVLGAEVRQRPCIKVTEKPTTATAEMVGELRLYENSEDLTNIVYVCVHEGGDYFWKQVEPREELEALRNFISSKADKIAPGKHNQVYIESPSGVTKGIEMATQATRFTIPQRNETGALIVKAKPTLDNEAVSKGYVENMLSNKVDMTDYYGLALLEPTPNEDYEYTWDKFYLVVQRREHDGSFSQMEVYAYSAEAVDAKISALEAQIAELASKLN